MGSSAEIRVTTSAQPERRANTRFRINTAIAPRVNCIDISEGGAQLEVSLHLERGTVTNLRLQVLHPNLPSTLPYQVLCVRPAATPGRYFVHGRFINLSTPERDTLRTALYELTQQSLARAATTNPTH